MAGEVAVLVNIFKKGYSSIPLGTVATHHSSRPHLGVADNQGSFSLSAHLQLWWWPHMTGPNACAHMFKLADIGRWRHQRTAAGLRLLHEYAHASISELQAPSKFPELSMECKQSHFKIKMPQWENPDTNGTLRRVALRYCAARVRAASDRRFHHRQNLLGALSISLT